MASMRCEICNAGPMDGVSIHRINQVGVDAVWRCKPHLPPGQKLDPLVDKLVEDIEDFYAGQSEGNHG